MMFRSLAITVSAAVLIAAAVPGAEAAPKRIASSGGAVTIDVGQAAGEMIVPVNKSQLLRVNRQIGEITVGNHEIAQVAPLSKTQAYIMGKKPGTTNLSITDGNGKVIAVVDVVVSADMDGLKARLHEVMPGEAIEVRGAAGSVVLSGMVSTADKLREAAALAERYAPGAVNNMLSVGGSQQVLLQVRFAEVQRTTAKQLGINNNFIYNSGGNTVQLLSGEGISPDSFGAALGLFTGGHYTLATAIDALEEKGLVRTLAEPNIIALSGDTAKFLAGGEFPIPVANNLANGVATITVEFKEFGVGLSFTPTVVGKELINLVMKTEVSAIDPSVSVTTQQISIPGLKVRRANTTVELKDGQSFAIAGLIQDDFQDGVRQVPGLGSLPVIGALLRSSDFQRQQTELVVFITAHLVQPVMREQLATPLDKTQVPNSAELFFLGLPAGRAASVNAGGIDGPYGYILP